MEQLNYEKITRITIAGICGIVGFAVTYVTLGWLFQPIQDWIEHKFEKGIK